MLELTRTSLGTQRFEAEVRRGAALTRGRGDRRGARVRDERRARVRFRRGARSRRADRPKTTGLTDRQREVLDLLVAGLSNKEIAARLGISPKTVMHHTTAIYQVLGVRGRAEAAVAAVRMQTQ